MPLVQTRGAASAQGFGEFAQQTAVNYIEDVFSTYLYTGNGSTQTITNNIDLSTKGGFVWIKDRTIALDHMLFDTARGADYTLRSNTTDAQISQPGRLSTFNTNGFSIGNGNAYTNGSGDNYASWTFRKQPKFFDVVTWTGTGGASQTIAHNLGSVPGCIIVKRTDGIRNWAVYHRSLTSSDYSLLLNLTGAEDLTGYFTSTPTSTTFSVGPFSNTSSGTFVAYLFAHDAGGFGLTGTDNVISCGSFDAASVTTTTLGYEPQYLLFKRTDSTGNWRCVDNMRGWPNSGNPQELSPNLSAAETSNGGVNLIATGFTNVIGSGTYIYIAIRRGPMKVPTTGTSVYDAQYAYSSPNTYRSTLTVDTAIQSSLDSALNHEMYTRLTGTNYLVTNDTAAQVSNASARFDTQTGFNTGVSTPPQYFAHLFRRAPSVHDVVCWTGNSTSGRTITHNLAAVPQLMIVKSRSNVPSWAVYYGVATNALRLNANTAATSETYWNNTSPTASVFSVGDTTDVNQNNYTYVAYLFATCAGVSKVGSYTGTGTTQTINCGFTAGSRFVMIKRTDSTGDWYVWDSERGIVSGNDPYLLLNTTAAQVTGTDYVDTAATGFEISSTAPAAINANGGTYIFLAIA